MKTLLDALNTLPLSVLDAVVHIGAGSGQALRHYARKSPGHLTLVEGDPVLAARLQERARGLSSVRVIPEPIGESSGSTQWYRYSLPAINGPATVTTLSSYYPRLTLLETLELKSVSMAELIASARIELSEGQTAVLILDVPGQESGLIGALPQDALEYFQYVIVRGCREPMGPARHRIDSAVELLAQRGYALLGLDSHDEPLWPVARFRLAPEASGARIDDLKAALEALQAENYGLRTELAAQRVRSDEDRHSLARSDERIRQQEASIRSQADRLEAMSASLAERSTEIQQLNEAALRAQADAERSATSMLEAQTRWQDAESRRQQADAERDEALGQRDAALALADQRLAHSRSLIRSRDEHERARLDHERSIASLRAELTESSEALEKLAIELNATRAEHAGAMDLCASKQRMIEELEAEAACRADELSTLKARENQAADNLVSRTVQLENDVLMLRATLTAASQHVLEQEGEIAHARKDAFDADAHLVSLQKELESTKSAQIEVKGLAASRQEALQAAQEAAAIAETSLRSLIEKDRDQALMLDTLQSSLREAEARATELSELHTSEKARAAACAARLEEMASRLADAEASRAATDALASQQERRFSELTAEHEQLKASAAEIERAKEELGRIASERNARLHALLQERTDSLARVEASERSLSDLQLKHAELAAQLDSALAEASEVNAMYSQALRDAAQSQAVIAALREQLGNLELMLQQRESALSTLQGSCTAIEQRAQGAEQKLLELEHEAATVRQERDAALASLGRARTEATDHATASEARMQHLARELSEARMATTLSLKLQLLKESDLRDLQERYRLVLLDQQRQHELLSRLGSRLATAQEYFQQLSARQQSVGAARQRVRTTRSGTMVAPPAQQAGGDRLESPPDDSGATTEVEVRSARRRSERRSRKPRPGS